MRQSSAEQTGFEFAFLKILPPEAQRLTKRSISENVQTQHERWVGVSPAAVSADHNLIGAQISQHIAQLFIQQINVEIIIR